MEKKQGDDFVSIKAEDLSEMRFGKLVVIERDFDLNGKSKAIRWKCKCDCGKIVSVIGANLKRGDAKSCGCARFNDLTGKTFGRWTVLEKTRKQQRNQVYLCRCECGNMREVTQSNLTQGKSQSCGCLQKELTSKRFTTHGMRKSRLYDIYANMKARCTNPNNKRYDSYGGRGIGICQDWNNSFDAFKKWALSHGYSDDLTIDRINVDGDYCPENCRWANQEQQSNNQQKTIWIKILGERRSLKQWTTFMGWNYGTYSARYRKGLCIFKDFEIEEIKKKLQKE